MGQILISPDSISSHLYIVIEGEARLRGFSLNKKSAYTLGLLGPLSVLGLTSLRLKKSVGLVTASKKSSLLCIPENLWEEFSLEVKKDPYSQFNIPDVDQAELWYLITRKFVQASLPKDPKDFKAFLRNEIEKYKCFSSNDSRDKEYLDLEKYNFILIERNKSGLKKISSLSPSDLKKLDLNNEINRIIYWPKVNFKENIQENFNRSDEPKNTITDFKKETDEDDNTKKELEIDESLMKIQHINFILQMRK